MELNGYCPRLKMAFEYNGKQHYEYCPNHFHKDGLIVFVHQRIRDIAKRNLCKANGVKLIVIPYTYSYLDPGSLDLFIYDELHKVS
jgi:hypothetical protein